MNTRNILLIGRTGSGKSTLANVLMGNDGNKKFTESFRSVSETRQVEEGLVEIDLSRDGSEKIRYRVIDTIGIGDTKLTPRGVLTRLAEIADRVKEEGLNQIFFVTKGRFSKEEIEAYDLLSSIIFDKKVLDYTTIVRTDFPEFEDKEICSDDRAALRMENADLAHILCSVNVIYVDNPPLKGRNALANEETRAESRNKLLDYLATCCRGNYRPSNIDTLDERVNEYKTNEQKLKDKMKELEKDRERMKEEFNKKIANLEEDQAKALRENQRKFDEKLDKAKKESDKKLEETKKKLKEDGQRELNNAEKRAKERERVAEEKHNQELKAVKEAQEQSERNLQNQLQQSKSEVDNLRKQLNEKKDNSDIIALITKMSADNQAREDKREEQRQDHELQMEREKQKTEQKRIDAEKTREERRQQEEAEKDEKHQEQIKDLEDRLEREAQIEVRTFPGIFPFVGGSTTIIKKGGK